MILEGAARIEVEGRETLDVREGSIFSLPAGARTR